MLLAEHHEVSPIEDGQKASVVDVRAIIGPVDDVIVTEILRTGASLHEIQQAYLSLEEHFYTKSVVRKKMENVIRCVYDILDYERSHLRRDY